MKVMHPNSSPIDIDNDKKFISRWRPIEGWLVADGDDFVLPVHHSSLAQQFYKSYCRKANVEIVALVFLLGSMLLFQTAKPISPYWMHLVVIEILLLFAIADKKISSMCLHNCKQKVEFLFNVKLMARKMAVAFTPFFIVLFVLQTLLTHHYGGYDNFVMQLGNYYPNISINSSWRFITGPLIHADSQHLIINAVLTFLFASMIPRVTISKAFLILGSGAVASHFFTYLFAQHFHSSFDALLGISGGSFALLAYTSIYYYRIQHTNTALSLFAIFIISELSLWLLSNNVSHIAHFSGFLSGVFANMLSPTSVQNRQQKWKVPEER